ncbi:acyl-CoA desaturase [Aliiglaciecola litoralis]|uniref:Fatty acid desaturase n=1 Tax=Aliiglaciecola litoralis TaxID=582857 RepID=A0ABP3WNY8_9ALTE
MKKAPIILTNILVFSITGLIALVGVPLEAYFNGFDGIEIGACIFLIYFSGMSITAGYHRLWSHKSYDAHPVVRFVLAIGGAMALQNSILHWCSDHRVHHRFVDQNGKDPYSAKQGFFFSHIGWMLRDYQSQRYSNYSNCKDLQKDAIVMWQHKYYLPLVLATNFGIPALLGLLNGDVLGMLLLAGVFRLVAVHHVTFFINSLAHIWGKQPYTDKNTARDNGFIAFFTFGEGYHNYHHIFEYDYRNGIEWWQFDPTKWLIGSLAFVGLAKNLRRVPEERIEKARMAMMMQRTQQRISTMHGAEELMNKLQREYDVLMTRMSDYYEIKKSLLENKQASLKKSYENLELAYKYREMKQRMILQKRKWLELNQLRFAMN